MRLVELSRLGLALAAGGALSLPAQVSVLTAHNDNARTGLNSNETLLTHTNVSPHGFGKLFSQSVDGPVYAQPLYAPNVAIPGQGGHNVVLVATQHDSVYAFDADSGTGANAAVVWELVLMASGTASLRAYNADDLAQKLYDSYASTQAGAPDQIGFVKFAVPTIASGKVYVGTGDSVAVFGLRFVLQSIQRDPGSGVVQLVFRGPAGIANRIEASTDLRGRTSARARQRERALSPSPTRRRAARPHGSIGWCNRRLRLLKAKPRDRSVARHQRRPGRGRARCRPRRFGWWPGAASSPSSCS